MIQEWVSDGPAGPCPFMDLGDVTGGIQLAKAPDMYRTPLATFALFAALAACASPSENVESNPDNNLTATKKVAGFNFEGFQISETAATAEFCTEEVDALSQACFAAGGEGHAVKGCASLCSVPVAERGKVAGFDLDGFQKGQAPTEAELCPEIVDAVAQFCFEAGGKTTAMKGCRSVCSVPVAGNGQVAGYDFTGPKILEATNPDDPEFCTQSILAEQVACGLANGKTVRAAGCAILCSTPIVPLAEE